MQREVFERDEGTLERGLFGQYNARWGAQTQLNVNFIPDLLQWVKGQLTGEELLRLEDYHLQNYLMELSVGYGGERSLSAVGSQILSHIRTHNNFWYRHNNQQQLQQEQTQQHQAISRYRQDLAQLADQLKQMPITTKSGELFPTPQHFEPYRGKKTAVNWTFHLLRRNTQPHFGTRQPLNHLSLLPTFLSQNPDKMQMLQECVLFLLSNKATNNGRRVQVTVGTESEESRQQEQVEQAVTLLDEFEQYMQTVVGSSSNKLPNSHHMRTLTHNLIATCRQLLKLPLSSSGPRTQVPGPLQLLTLSPSMTEILRNLSQRELTQQQITEISNFFILRWQNGLQIAVKQMRKRERQTLLKGKGWVSSAEEIEKVKAQYQEMLDNPQFVELTRCRAVGSGVPWKEQDYLSFLKALGDFLNIPTNNKKIASAMGENIEPNHVKHVKAVYLAVMKERLERGECGGGKRGKSLSKADFLQKDIAAFSLRWFEKAKKIRKRKPKRKRRNSSQEEAEDDHDSEY